MTGNAEQAWTEVGERFSSWGRRLAGRYHAAGGAEAATAEETEQELQRIAKDVIDELSRSFTALGKTLRDDQANQDLGAAVTAMGDAITATVKEASQAIRSGRSAGSDPPD